MDDAEYKAFVESAYEGRVLIGVDRAFARKLYTNVRSSWIEETTGEAPYLEKFVVWFAFLGSPVAMLGSAVASAFAFGWWAVVVIPASLTWWLVNRSISVRAGSSIWFLSLLVIATASVHLLKLLPSAWISGFFVFFAVGLWCDRLLYCASTFFLRAFILRNPRAFAAFGDNIAIRQNL